MGGAAPFIGPAVAIGSAIMGSKSASKAAKAQTAAANKANATELEMYNQSRADLAPYRETGALANTKLSTLMGLAPDEAALRESLRENYTTRKYGAKYGRLKSEKVDQAALDAEVASRIGAFNNDPDKGMLTKRFSLADYVADPGYQFRLDQGNKAINAKNAAMGNFYSGGALKEATDYNSGMASQEYGNAYNRYNTDMGNLYSRYGGLSEAGRNATNTAVGMGQNYANQVGQNYANIGSAQANAAINKGNAWSQGLSGLMGSQYGGGQPFYSPAGTGQSGFWLGNTFFG